MLENIIVIFYTYELQRGDFQSELRKARIDSLVNKRSIVVKISS